MKKTQINHPNKIPNASHRDPEMFLVWVNEGNYPRKRLTESEKTSYKPEVIKAFEDALLDVEDRIWIMDPYFDAVYGLNSIWFHLCQSQAREIKIISHEAKPEKWIEKQIAEYSRKPDAEIQWKVCFHELHDRFAFLDDELWHFGSTVGGGYPGFGAASRGWATDHMNYVFNSRWET